MKRLFTILAFSLLPLLMYGQAKEINDILDKYEKKKSVESIMVSPSLLEMSGNNGIDEKTKDLMSKISQLRIINVKSSAIENGRKVSDMLREDLQRALKGERFNRILRVQEENQLLEMYKSVQSKGVLVFIASEKDELSVISIFGDIDQSVLNAAISGEIKVK